MTVTIELTVQPSGRRGNYVYRLGINSHDSKTYFKMRGRKVDLILEKDKDVVIKTKMACGPPDNDWERKENKKGYDLNSKDIDKWIRKHEFHLYRDKDPTKLLFELNAGNEPLKLSFIVVAPRSRKFSVDVV